MNITRLRPLKTAPTSSIAGNQITSKPYAIRPEASVLLAEVVAQLHGIVLPIVQFLPACRVGSSGHLSRAFAAAAVERFGRTLLVDAGAKGGVPERSLAARSTGKRQRRAPAVTPDVDIAGLYHRLASDASMEAIAADTPETQPFNMVIVQSVTPSLCPSSLDRARQCHGSILTVAAGTTTLSELQASARQLRLAGGTLLGTVLFDVPRLRLW